MSILVLVCSAFGRRLCVPVAIPCAVVLHVTEEQAGALLNGGIT
jgi:hypothetical protein